MILCLQFCARLSALTRTICKPRTNVPAVVTGCETACCNIMRMLVVQIAGCNSTMMMLQVALEGIKNILASAEKMRQLPGAQGENVYAIIFEDAGGLDLLEGLQNHNSEDISVRAVEILSTFFEVVPEDENAMPNVDGTGMLNFGAAPQSNATGAVDPAGAGGGAAFNFGGL